MQTVRLKPKTTPNLSFGHVRSLLIPKAEAVRKGIRHSLWCMQSFGLFGWKGMLGFFKTNMGMWTVG